MLEFGKSALQNQFRDDSTLGIGIPSTVWDQWAQSTFLVTVSFYG